MDDSGGQKNVCQHKWERKSYDVFIENLLQSIIIVSFFL